MESSCTTRAEGRRRLVPIGIRLDPDDLDWLTSDAEANSRTVAQSIRHCIRIVREQAA